MIQSIKKNLGFLCFLFLFSWVITIKNQLSYAGSWEELDFYWDAPFWLFLNALLIFYLIEFLHEKVFQVRPNKGLVRYYLRFFLITLIGYLLFWNLFAYLIASLFRTADFGFHSNSLQLAHRLMSQTVDFLIFGGFSMAYHYYRQKASYEARLAQYEISLAKRQIHQLKAQLNPHFLFNSLNILDQLIDENSKRASNYLNQLAEVYRLALRTSEKELIPLKDEVQFIRQYFNLLQVRFKGNYRLHIEKELTDLNVLVPPFCLQVLVENVISHNVGTKNQPIDIRIWEDDGIVVQNKKMAKRNKYSNSGIALDNLNRQFELLCNKSIRIDSEDQYFTVILPLMKIAAND